MVDEAEVVSVPSLVLDLCKLVLGQPDRASLVQPKYKHSEKLKKLKAKAWTTLLGQLGGPLCMMPSPSNSCQLSEIDHIYSYSYVLRTKRQFDNAYRLETLVEHLMKVPGSRVSKNAVLKLLMILADTKDTCDQSVIGHQFKAPVAAIGDTVVPLLPNGPLEYGDTRVHTVNKWYMHFPSQIFEQPGLDTKLHPTDNKADLVQIFNSIPGSHLPGLFQAKGCLGDIYEHFTYNSLYGALVHSTGTSVDLQLSLPDLNDSSTPPEIKIPQFTRNMQSNGTELLSSPSSGYISPADSGLGSTEADLTGSETDIWQKALEYVPSKNRVWENVGRVPGPTELPYLSEAGSEALDCIWAIHVSHLRLINPELEMPIRHRVEMNKLVGDVINLLLGIPSTSFMLDLIYDEFHIQSGLYLSGLTPETLAQACQEAVECGTSYHRLAAFSHSVVINSFYQGGLIFQAFTIAVARYLQHYRAFILSIPTGKTLLEINVWLNRVYKQIRFLAELCYCKIPGNNADELQEPFPTGVHLLSYLYQHTIEVNGSDLYPMMLSLFTSSCGPYLVFVQDWVFHGICRDIYQEFMIQVNDDYLRYKDKHYWTKGYVMISDNTSTAVPLFLSHLSNDIFVGGKTMNLMRLIAPQHFLFKVDNETPRVMITFSEEELQGTEINCQAYLSRMQQIARRETLSRQQVIERAEKAKQDLMTQAKKVAAEELARIQAITRKKREMDDARKRKLFTELKQQMETDLKRRATEREQNKEEDKSRISETKMQEILDIQVEEELEKQAREELIEYYAKLSAEATLREQKALWKVRRGQLDAARREFLLKENAQLAAELEEVKHHSDMAVTSSSKEPPSGLDIAKWTDDASNPSRPLEGMTALPDWARKGLQTAPPGFEVIVTEDLPVWAKRALEGGDTEVPAATAVDAKSSQVDVRELDVREADGPAKRHPSHSSVGDIMRSEPAVKHQLEGIRHVDVQRAERSKNSHPHASSIQELIYNEPVQKERDKKSDPIKDTNNKVDDNRISGGDQNDEITRKLKVAKLEDSESSVANPDIVNSGDSKSQPALRLIPKSQIRLIENRHATTESKQQDIIRPSVRLQENQDILAETTPNLEKPSTKLISGRHISEQSEESVQKYHTVMSKTMGATNESEECIPRSHLKSVENKHSSLESKPVELKCYIKCNLDRNATQQSSGEEVKVKPRSMFGHVSDLSTGEYIIAAPKLKRGISKHPSMESEYKTFQVKPHRRKKVAGRGVDQLSEEVMYRAGVRVNPAHHPSVESSGLDIDKERLERFKQMNVKGHASDSTVQKLLYGQRHVQEDPEEDDEVLNLGPVAVDPVTSSEVEPYRENFNFDCSPAVDLMTHQDHPLYGSLGDYGISTNPNISAFNHIPLPALLKQSITTPLITQISLVNESVVNYFTTELDLDGHLERLRQFLLMEDGEFGERLGDLLFEKLSLSPRMQEMFNPTFLNDVLSQAIRSSMHADDKYTENISFSLRFMPTILRPNAPNALDCLELTYRVPWPMNIIITDNSLKKYGRVFTFMLQLKHVIWVLKDVWHQLKRDALINKADSGSQFRQLQIYRHEMQYFVRVMQGYLSNQIIHVTWLELREDFSSNVRNLDDLHNYHDAYLNKCLSRCLLNKKAEPVMKIIQDIFGLILKFRMQLVSYSWHKDHVTGDVSHPAFEHLNATYNAFSNYSRFLFKVISKLAIKGYQPHLQELLLRLNFNMHYNSDIF